MKLHHILPNFTAKVLDDPKGIVEYVASDETVDSDREVVRARGWNLSQVKQGMPFIDSHQRGSIAGHLGKVVGAEVKGGRLIETVQWAIDAPENRLAKQGFQMVQAGYGSRVSVGFVADNIIYPEDAEFAKHIRELGIKNPSRVRRIFDGQTQVELSAVLVGANLNALALGYKNGIFTDADLEHFESLRESPSKSARDHDAQAADRRARQDQFLKDFNAAVKSLTGQTNRR